MPFPREDTTPPVTKIYFVSTAAVYVMLLSTFPVTAPSMLPHALALCSPRLRLGRGDGCTQAQNGRGIPGLYLLSNKVA